MKWLCDYTKQDQRGFREVLDPNAKEDKHTGIHLMAADGYILENYDINLSSDDSSKNKIACQDVYIKLLGKPEDTSAIIIDSQTNIAFEDGLVLAVKGPITLGKCKNLKIKSHDFGREVTLKGGFSLKGVTDSIIRFEKPREEMKKPITDGLVSFNKVHKVDISIPENVKKAEIRDNFNGGMAILNGAPLNRIGISAFEIVMGSCNYSFHTQYSSLDISADIVRCESATFSSEYNGAIEVKSGKKDERSEFKAKEADFNFYGNGILKAYTPTLIFDSVKINHNGSFTPIKITNSTILVSPLIFFCSEALMVNFRVDFEPTTLDGREVYEVKNEHGHYCYMTPEMVDKIFELRPGGKDRYIDSFSFTLAISRGYFVKLKNKLLLDLPEKVDANSFDSMTFPFTQYTENVKKEPVVLKVQRQYHLNGLGKDSGAIELILPNNKLECNNFKIYSQQKTDQILEINTKNSKMDVVFVDNLVANNISAKEVYLSVSFENEGGILFVQTKIS